jgi:hypothetical protein
MMRSTMNWTRRLGFECAVSIASNCLVNDQATMVDLLGERHLPWASALLPLHSTSTSQSCIAVALQRSNRNPDRSQCGDEALDRLRQLIVGLLIAFALFGPNVAVAAEPYCSLSVRVLSPDGRRPEVPVSVRENNGRVVDKEQEGNDVSFCDLGILPVTVTVGVPGCNETVVKDVPIAWEKPYLLVMTYDVEPCIADSSPPPVPFCRVLLRISDSTGRSVSGASAQFEGTRSVVADDAGRLLFTLKLEQKVSGVVASPGYLPARFSVVCSRNERTIEEPVRLQAGTLPR